MKNKLTLWCIIFVGFFLSGCQSSSPLGEKNVEEILPSLSYATQQVPSHISCDEYNIQSIKDLGYTGDVTPQGTGCVVNGIQHNYDVPSLAVRIVFDNTFSPYFLDQSKIPEITLQDNKIIYDKDHNLTVVKNYTNTLDHYIQATYKDCEYDPEEPIAPNEYQIKCEGSNYLYFHNISLVDSTIYDIQYPMGNNGFRFEIL